MTRNLYSKHQDDIKPAYCTGKHRKYSKLQIIGDSIIGDTDYRRQYPAQLNTFFGEHKRSALKAKIKRYLTHYFKNVNK